MDQTAGLIDLSQKSLYCRLLISLYFCSAAKLISQTQSRPFQ